MWVWDRRYEIWDIRYEMWDVQEESNTPIWWGRRICWIHITGVYIYIYINIYIYIYTHKCLFSYAKVSILLSLFQLMSELLSFCIFPPNICWGSLFIRAVTVLVVIVGFPLFGTPHPRKTAAIPEIWTAMTIWQYPNKQLQKTKFWLPICETHFDNKTWHPIPETVSKQQFDIQYVKHVSKQKHVSSNMWN